MSFKALLLVFFCVFLDVGREISLKLGSREEETLTPENPLIYLRNLFGKPFVILGIIFWATQVVFWIVVLETAPLSVAFPILSLCYCGTLLASRLILKERVNRYKWLGAGLITVGVILIGSS